MAAAASLVGCGSGSAASQPVRTVTVTSSVQGNSGSAAVPEEDAASSSTATTEASVNVLKFGQTFSFTGWSVSVSAPVPFTPSSYAATEGKHAAYRAMTVTVKNTSTGKALDPNLVYVTGQVGEAEVDSVYDSEKGVDSSPSAKILPGRSVSWKIVYGVTPGASITVQVEDQASFDGPTAIFDGKA